MATLLPVFNIIAVLVKSPIGFTVMRVLSSLCYPVIYQLVFTLGKLTGNATAPFSNAVLFIVSLLAICLFRLH